MVYLFFVAGGVLGDDGCDVCVCGVGVVGIFTGCVDCVGV